MMSNTDALYPKGELGKAAAPNYCPSPFYFVQTAPSGEIRIPCWSSDPTLLRDLMFKILESFPGDLRVLIKVEHESSPRDSDPWRRHHGYCSKSVIERALTLFQEFLLRDSTHQFCVRNPDSGEYFALDEYGVLWLYPNDRSIESVLGVMGFENKLQELVSARGCWKYVPADSKQRCRELLDFLMLNEDRQEPYPISNVPPNDQVH